MASNEKLGGYTLDELFGIKPIARPPEKKKSPVAKLLGAPFKLIGAVIKLPFTVIARVVGGIGNAIGEIAKLPLRLLRALIKPWKN
jgi:hypothetical protein